MEWMNVRCDPRVGQTSNDEMMMMMMKFMFNVAAMTWMMSDSRIWAQY